VRGRCEYVSSDAFAAIYASTREPQLIFEELALSCPDVTGFQRSLAEAEAKMASVSQ